MAIDTLRFPLQLSPLLAAALLSACGGGGGGDDPPPERATIVTAQLAGQVTTAQIDAGTSASGLQALSGAAQCGVDVRYVYYVTRDAAGQPTTASAGVLVPSGTAAACTGDRPVVLYAHGTSTDKAKNMADVSKDSEASLMMAMYAAQGFIVVAPNYIGYEHSSATYHPFLNAEAQAVDMVDGLRAAKAHLAQASSTKASSKLFLTGYSQGGHVAMATHKVIERDYASEFTVTASGPMSGPYNLAGLVDVVATTGPVNAGATLFVPLLLTSYQKSYGGVYSQVGDAYQAPYAATAENLLPSTSSVTTLISEGKLPADSTFTKLWGTGGLLTDSFKTAYPTSKFRSSLQANTLLGWTPRRPMALCGGALDPTIFWALNGPVAKADFASRSVTVPTWDLETAPATSDASYPVYAAFAQAKARTATAAVTAGAPDSGASAVQAAYHGTLVPPFCNALMRGYFQQVLAAGL
jgi:hypothetical protein